MTDVQIAKHCGVSSQTIGRYRSSIIKPFNDTGVKTATRGGKSYKMDTGNIGKKRQVAPVEPEPVDVAPTPQASSGPRAVPPTWEEVWDALLPFYQTQLKAPRFVTKSAEGVYLATLKLCGCEVEVK